MELSSYQRSKLDESDDSLFYSQPRFLHHLDKGFRKRLEQHYIHYLKNEYTVLDLMSSWVSHLPKSLKLHKVIGHGMNQDELKANPLFDSYWIQDLNKNQNIPLDSDSFDASLIVAGWQYLQYPEKISKEIARVTKPSGLIIVSFSNRAFWSKSPNVWIDGDDVSRLNYVKSILISTGWQIKCTINEKIYQNAAMRILGYQGDPFLSIVASNS